VAGAARDTPGPGDSAGEAVSTLETVRFVLAALRGQRLRSVLSALGVAIGVTAVVLLTSLGQGTREYIVGQFTQFGTSIIGINPGKVKTFGMPGVFGGTTHKLTIDDAEALRRVSGVEKVVPVAFGQARVEFRGVGRSVYTYGVNHELPATWNFGVGQGSFLPEIDPHRQGSFAVLGPKLAHEIFGATPPLGERVRVGGRGFVVVGIMAPKGQLLGFDVDDSCYIPVASAMDLFNLTELQEIDVLAANTDAIPSVVQGIRTVLSTRHRGEEDFTITTQTEMLDTFGRVMNIITIAVSAIAAISLLVGAMGILTIMWISVHERTGEIGLLRALGVTRAGVQRLFLYEALALATSGGVVGILAGAAIVAAARFAVSGLPLSTPPEAVAAALVMSVVVGIGSGIVPARRAASLDPVDALRAE
jgi:putative ABC transport system permease protein